jgi:hypothetical protein
MTGAHQVPLVTHQMVVSRRPRAACVPECVLMKVRGGSLRCVPCAPDTEAARLCVLPRCSLQSG